MASIPSHATPAGDEAALAAMLRDAVAKFERNDLPGAADACQRILDLNPFYAPALHAMGWIAFRRGEIEHAVANLAQAAAAAPDAALYSADLGRLLVQLQRLDHAIEPLRRAVDLDPSPANLSDLGYVLHAMGQLDEAEATLQRALRLDGRNVPALCNLGAVQRARNQPARAADSYAAAAKLAPQLFEAHLFEGVSNAEAGYIDRAERCWERALALRSSAPILHDVGAVLLNARQPKRALIYLRRAVQAAPTDVSQLNALASALIEAAEYVEAESTACRAIEIGPDDSAAHVNLAAALYQQRRYEESIATNRRALDLDRSLARARANLADALSQLARDDEAIPLAREAALAAPNDDVVHGVHTSVLLRAQRPLDAVAVARDALAIAPSSAVRHYNLAVALNESDQPDASIESLHQTLSLDPRHALARSSLGMIRLTRGNLQKGWADYDTREKPPTPAGMQRWDGRALSGRPILLQVEQGFGDIIHFIRYAALIAKHRGGRPSVLCTAHLQRLLQTVPSIEHVVTRADDPRIAKARHAALLLDLPRIFDTTLETIPGEVPYLSVPPPADPQKREALDTAIISASKGGRRVGIVWGGGAVYVHNRKRSIPIELIKPIVGACPDVTFYSLLVNPISDSDRSAMRDWGIINLADHLADFGETAAAIDKLDLVISVDTAVAHLAGALAKPVWIMLPRVPDWRWLRDREDSPWYPTARLFRQEHIGDWPAVITRVADELAKL